MKFLTWVLSLALLLSLGLVSEEAEARRLGGGKSLGKQSNQVTQREAAPQAPAAPAAQGTPNAANAAPAAAATAAARPAATAAAQGATRKPWGAMLTGVAAGLGLAWLASSLGFGEELAQFMLMALLALVVMAVVGWFMRSRRPAPAQAAPYAYQGGYADSNHLHDPREGRPSTYKPENVGNDASARPWERSSMAFQSQPLPPAHAQTPAQKSMAGFTGIGAGLEMGSTIPAALTGSQTWGVPPGFDADGFLGAAKKNFITLQDAWDRNDTSTLRSMMTDDMLQEIKVQLAEREQHTGGVPNKTEVSVLSAQLLGIEELSQGYMASVEFSGMIREDQSTGPAPFREVWNMVKPKDGSSGWLVAGLQALH
jgi:predicted lipid-binding transport protein (Tim44 family)